MSLPVVLVIERCGGDRQRAAGGLARGDLVDPLAEDAALLRHRAPQDDLPDTIEEFVAAGAAVGDLDIQLASGDAVPGGIDLPAARTVEGGKPVCQLSGCTCRPGIRAK